LSKRNYFQRLFFFLFFLIYFSQRIIFRPSSKL
jgi:hypothetical protein